MPAASMMVATLIYASDFSFFLTSMQDNGAIKGGRFSRSLSLRYGLWQSCTNMDGE
jgi:hypothetical protein